MATPAFKSVGTWNFTANNVPASPTLSPGAPSGVVAGDLLILISESRSNSATATTPAGWNLVSGFPKRSATTSGGTIYVWTRIAGTGGSGNDTPSVAWTGLTSGTSGDSTGAGILRYSGGTETLDNTVQVSDLSAQTTTSVIPAFTTQIAETLVIGIAMKLLESSGQSATVATFTERADNSTTSGTGHEIEISEHISATVGSSGSATVTWSATTSARALTVSLGLKPVQPAIAPDTGINSTSAVSSTVRLETIHVATDTGINATSTVTATLTAYGALLPSNIWGTSPLTSPTIPPASVLSASFDLGISGRSISTGDTGFATKWDQINGSGTGGTITYDNTHVAHGNLSAHFVGTAATSEHQLHWVGAFGTQSEWYGRQYFYLPAATGGRMEIVSADDGGGGQLFNLRLGSGSGGGTNHQLSVYNTNTQLGIFTNVIPLGQWVRWEYHVKLSTSGAGIIEVKLFLTADSITPDETLTFTGLTMTSATAGGEAYGNCFNDNAGAYEYWFDEIVTGAAAYPGPVSEIVVSGIGSLTPASINATSAMSATVTDVPGSHTDQIAPDTGINATSAVTASLSAYGAITPDTGISSTSAMSATVVRIRPVVTASINSTSAVSSTVRLETIHVATDTGINSTSDVTATAPLAVKFITASINSTSAVTAVVNAIHTITPDTGINATSAVSAALAGIGSILPASISSTSDVTAAVVKLGAVSASITASSTVTAALVALRAVSASISSTSDVTASLAGIGSLLPASISAVSDVTAALVAQRAINASISSTSNVTSTLNVIWVFTGSISSTSDVTATLTAYGQILPASISATSAMTAALVAQRAVSAALTASSDVTALVTDLVQVIPASIPATSDISAVIELAGAQKTIVPGAINATSDVSAAVVRLRNIPASIATTSDVTATLNAIHVIAGAAPSATSSISATVIRIRPIAASISSTSNFTALVTDLRPVSPASISATSSTNATVTRIRPITTASISSTSNVTSTVYVLKHITVSCSATSTVTSGIVRIRHLSGTLSATSTVSGAVVRIRHLTASASATSAVSAYVGGLFPLTVANVMSTSTVAGEVTIVRQLPSAVLSASSDVTATLTAPILGADRIELSLVSTEGNLVLITQSPPSGSLATSTVSAAADLVLAGEASEPGTLDLGSTTQRGSIVLS